MSTPTPTTPKKSALALLVATSLSMSGLALYQWQELLVVRAGGTAKCSVNAEVDCAKVWDSAFAASVHNLLGMPVAGLGLVWGLVAVVLSLVLARRSLAGGELVSPLSAVKVWGQLGVLSSVTFGVASARLGVVCPTCLGTYALCLAFALVAIILLPAPRFPEGKNLIAGAVWCGVATIPIFLLMLIPGGQTPKSTSKPLAPAADDAAVMKYFDELKWIEKQAVSDSLQAWKRSPQPDVSRFAVRNRLGAENAPVKLVDFTDVLCGHCKTLVEELKQLEAAVPKGSLSIEPRYFPLDGECNRVIQRAVGDGIRCTGAKAQLCLEGRPAFQKVHEELFENQQGLTKEKILEIASQGMPRADLEACIASPETQARLEDDIRYAMEFHPQGTPIVILNGHETPPSRAFIFGMVMAKGNPNAKFFQSLPPPSEHEDRHDHPH